MMMMIMMMINDNYGDDYDDYGDDYDGASSQACESRYNLSFEERDFTSSTMAETQPSVKMVPFYRSPSCVMIFHHHIMINGHMST